MKDWSGNKVSVFKTLGSSAHSLEEREMNDYYATDPIAIDKLLQVETPSRHIWECACGEGHLAKRLKEKGFDIHASDLVNRNYGFQEDFLKVKKPFTSWLDNCDILTNPPYKYAKEFVLKALELVADQHKVYMFLKLTFLEGKARFKEIFSKNPPRKIYVFSDRLMCAKNGEFSKYNNKGVAHGAVAYGWFVWQKGWNGKTTVEWI